MAKTSEKKAKGEPYKEFQMELRLPFEAKPILEQVAEMFKL